MKLKTKILGTIAIFLIIIIVIGGYYYYVHETTPETDTWTWNFEADIWHEVTFTQEMFDAVDGDEPETILASILDVSGRTWVFQQQPGEGLTRYWDSESPTNRLTNILPNVICDMYVENDCILIIEKQ